MLAVQQMEKVYLTLTFFGLLHPPTMKPSVLPPELSKTSYFTPDGFFSNSGFATVTVGCYSAGGFEFPFLFIFGEFLKNHSKS